MAEFGLSREEVLWTLYVPAAIQLRNYALWRNRPDLRLVRPENRFDRIRHEQRLAVMVKSAVLKDEW